MREGLNKPLFFPKMSTDVLYFSFSHSALVLARVRSLRSRACSFSEKNDEKEKESNVCVQATIKQHGNFRTFRQARVFFVDFFLANTPVIFIVKLWPEPESRV